MTSSTRTLASTMLSVTLAACADRAAPVAPRDDQRSPGVAGTALRTDLVEYRWTRDPLGYWIRVALEYRNPRSTPIYFEHCRPAPAGQRPGVALVLEDSTAPAPFIQPVSRECLFGGTAHELPAGATLRDTVLLYSTLSPNANPPIDPNRRIGAFRIYYDLFAGRTPSGAVDRTTRLPRAELRSNPFRISY